MSAYPYQIDVIPQNQITIYYIHFLFVGVCKEINHWLNNGFIYGYITNILPIKSQLIYLWSQWNSFGMSCYTYYEYWTYQRNIQKYWLYIEQNTLYHAVSIIKVTTQILKQKYNKIFVYIKI